MRTFSWTRIVLTSLALGMASSLLYLISVPNYPFFHAMVEIICIALGLAVYMVAWNTRHLSEQEFLIFIGFGLVFTSLFDLLHGLSYKGMNILPGYDTNLSDQFWIAARFMQSLSYLTAALVIGRKRPATSQSSQYNIAVVYFAAAVAILIAILSGVLPASYSEGRGATLARIASEYLISAIFLASLILFIIKRKQLDRSVETSLVLALAVVIVSELTFTGLFGNSAAVSVIGPILRLLSIDLLYLTVIRLSLVEPQTILYRNLKLNEEALRASQTKLNFILDSTEQSFILIGLDRRIWGFNASAVQVGLIFAGKEIQEGELMEYYLPPDMVAEFKSHFTQALNSETVVVEKEFTSISGRKSWFEFTYAPVLDERRKVVGVCVNALDSTRRKRAMQTQTVMAEVARAAISNQNLNQMCARIHELISQLMPAPNLYIAIYDRATETLNFTYYSDQLDSAPAGPQPLSRGLTEYIIRQGKPLSVTADSFARLIESGEVQTVGAPPKEYLGVPLLIENQAIGMLAIQSYTETVHYNPEDLDLLEFVCAQIAVAVDRKQHDEELIYMSSHDVLTGLFNRAYFEIEIDRLEHSRRRPISILSLDVDGLKTVNDTYGHAAGDELLRLTARVLRGCFRAEDLVARIGGDEFVVILPDTNPDGSQRAVERLLNAIAEINRQPGSFPFLLSIGSATADDSMPLRAAFQEADAAMYRDKNTRRRPLED